MELNSTINPNMPLRGFIYAGQEFDKWMKSQGLSKHIYGTRLVKIPLPRYYVLYNGREDAPEYLTARRGELMQMTLGEIPLEEMKEVWYGEGFEEGEAKGMSKGLIEGRLNEKHANIVAFLSHIPDAKMASEIYGIGIDDIRKVAKASGLTVK